MIWKINQTEEIGYSITHNQPVYNFRREYGQTTSSNISDWFKEWYGKLKILEGNLG